MLYFSPLNPLRFYPLAATPSEIADIPPTPPPPPTEYEDAFLMADGYYLTADGYYLTAKIALPPESETTPLPTLPSFPLVPAPGSVFPFIRNTDYVQKFAPADDIFIQAITSVSLADALDIYICNQHGKVVINNIPKYKERNAGGRSWKTWQIKFSDYNMQGLFVIVLRDNGSPKYHCASNVFCVHKNHIDLPYIHYRNTENIDEIWYGQGVNKHVDIFSLRVEGGFQEKNYIPKSDNTIYMGGDNRSRVLNSFMHYTQLFHVGSTSGGGIPDVKYNNFAWTLHNALACDTVFIDGYGYTLSEGSEWSANEVDNYDRRAWPVELAPTGEALERANLPEPWTVPQLGHPANYLYNPNNTKQF